MKRSLLCVGHCLSRLAAISGIYKNVANVTWELAMKTLLKSGRRAALSDDVTCPQALIHS